jgi:hypothetical protein
LCNPAAQAAEVSVDRIPADLANETTDVAEARDAVELDRAHGDLVARALLEQTAVGEPLEQFAGQVAEQRIRFHALHHSLEVAQWQFEIAVEFRDVVEVREVDARKPVVERFDDAGADRPLSPVLAPHDADERITRRVLRQYLRRFVGGAVIDDDPGCG